MNLYKKDIKGALTGVEINHDTKEETVISKEQAAKLVVEIFDDTVFHLLSYMATSKALTRILADNNIDVKDYLYAYSKYYDEEMGKQDIYKFEK